MYRPILTILFLLCSSFQFSDASAADTIIRVGGSGTGTGIIKQLAGEFEKRNPGIKIAMAPSLGSSGGIKALLGGSLDIAMSARPLKDNEKSSGAATVFSGRTPFAFMVNRSVAKTGISTGELVAIYGLRQQNWPDGTPIRLILRPEGDSDTKLIQTISPDFSQALKTAISQPGMHIALTDQDSDKAIVRTQGALGGTTIAQFKCDKLNGTLLALNGVKPTVRNLKDGSYPLAKKQMVIVIPARSNPSIKKFISYITSPRAIRIWEKSGVIPDDKV